MASLRLPLAVMLVLAPPVASFAGPAAGAHPYVPPPLAGPAPELGSGMTVELPTLPSFELPPSEPGQPGPHELRVRSHQLLGSEVKVTGYITWIYDCVEDQRRAGEARASTRRRIDADPTVCERAKLYLGDARDTRPEQAIWVVDVPRPPNKMERERLPRDQLAAWPKVPRMAVGDLVTVTGTWAMQSPHSERNSDGLLVFQAIDPARPRPASSAAPVQPPMRPAPPAVSMLPAPAGPGDAATRASSIRHMNLGVKASALKQYDAALTEYMAAIAAWNGNHLAWYGAAAVHIARKAWSSAAEAMRHAVASAPGEAMYHLTLGFTLYEAALAQAREDQARKDGRKSSEAFLELPPGASDAAMPYVAQALKLEPRLWRAHYLLGRMYRDRGDVRWAAEELDAALRTDAPSDPAPWIALIELERQWRYADQALQVARAATTVASHAASIWYELGMAYDDKQMTKPAIEAFTKSLELDPSFVRAAFQRGQAYVRLHDAAKAKIDLETFVTTGSGDDVALSHARKLLRDLPR